MNCRSPENYVADLDMEKGLREIITVKGKETIPPKNYDEIVRVFVLLYLFLVSMDEKPYGKKSFR